MKTHFFLFAALTILCLSRIPGHDAEAKPPDEGVYHSPQDLALLSDGRRVLTANQASDTVSLIDLEEGKVLAEQACAQKPVALTVSADGKTAAVSNLWSATITLFRIDKGGLERLGEVAVGPLPRSLSFSPQGEFLYAAVAGADEVVVIDCARQLITHRWPAPREPRHLALFADGRWLAAGSSRSGQVRCWDTSSHELYWERTIEDAFNLRGLAFTADGEGLVCAHAVRRNFPVTRENIEEGWVIDNRLTWLALRPDAVSAPKQIALDQRGLAAADLHGLAFSPDGRWLAVTAAGTGELLLLEPAVLPWNSGDPGDFLSSKLSAGEHKLRRVALGGRPLAVSWQPGGQAVVVNSLLDALQIVDGASGRLLRTIPLGASAPSTPVRRGEALFYDAHRSRHQWFSCSTCHVDGHTCGLNFDTLNDDSFGNPKLTPTLRGVTHTGPWTWHGWQKDLGAGVEKSFTTTMYGPRPSADEIQDLLAFLATLEHPIPPRTKLDEAIARGRMLFKDKAGCMHCHRGDHYTSPGTYDVGLEPDGSPYRLWNPPSLRGLWDRGPYLHDGRAKTLEELLDMHHVPEKLGGEALEVEEKKDLIRFLKSL
jgi:DNA-binding beta-propeller fold protein YncE